MQVVLASNFSSSTLYPHCVVPENIYAPTTQGISFRTPSSPNFPFFEVSYNPPIPPDFPQYDKHPPQISGKFHSRREGVKNEATDPNLIEEFPQRVAVLLINVTST